MRWKLMIQEYDFDIEHVAGEDNFVADAFSRLVAMPEDPAIAEVLAHTNVLKQVPLEKHKILCKVHNTNVGHFGEKLTLQRLRDAGHKHEDWPEMKEHVRAFIRKCPCCQKMSVLKTPIEHHPFVIASYEPMQKVAVDTLGPMQKDAYGNTHVCVITDCFSRFTMLVPTRDATVHSAAHAILQWCGFFGAPAELLSDRGTQFINHTIDDLLKLLMVEKLNTLAGVHEQNSIVERRIKEVNRHIRDILFHTKVKEHWSDSLPLVQRIMNAQRLLPTVTSPAQIIFGNSVNLDSGVLLTTSDEERKQKSKTQRLSEWTSKMLKLQRDIISAAQQTQQHHNEEYFKRFGDERTEFPVNSYVLVNYGNKNPPTKFHSYWRGPYRVVSQDVDDKNRYTVQNLVTNKLEDFPIHQMKAYLDNGFDSSERVAMTDDPMVEKILGHEGNRYKIPSLRFKVKWEDLSLEETSMETYASIKNTQPLHDYLNEIGGDWPALIPIEFTHEGEHYSERNTLSQQPKKVKKTTSNKR
jgi:transposase InsO family protein